jgi:hypothetical protein
MIYKRPGRGERRRPNDLPRATGNSPGLLLSRLIPSSNPSHPHDLISADSSRFLQGRRARALKVSRRREGLSCHRRAGLTRAARPMQVVGDCRPGSYDRWKSQQGKELHR